MANKCVCGWGFVPDPAGGAYNAPPVPRGPSSKEMRREIGGKGKERGGCLTSAGRIKGPAPLIG